jgi:ABC-type multidrug transport system ATPase subunit
MEILKAEGLKVNFGAKNVLKGAQVAIFPGEILLVVGRNGSGKTTLLRCLSGRLQSSGGQINSVESCFVMPVAEGFFGSLSVLQNLLAFAGLEKIKKNVAQERLEEFSKVLICNDILDKKYDHCSRGERQIAFVMRSMLVSRASLFLIDEPFAHLDPERCQNLLSLIVSHVEKNRSSFVLTGQSPIAHSMVKVRRLENGILT